MVGTLPLFGAQQEETTSDDYYTPSWVFEDLGLEFDLDVAAPPGGVPWIPAKRFLTKADDGLAQPWEGHVWMNPPFSAYTAWAHRFLEHGDGIALGSVGVHTRWLTALWEHPDVSIVLLPADMQFVLPGGGDARPMYRSALFGMGAWAREPLSRLGRVR
jgi:hypothetical protein